MTDEYIKQNEYDVLEYKPKFEKKTFVTEVDKSTAESLYTPSSVLGQLRQYAPSKASGLLGAALKKGTTLLQRLDKELSGVTGNSVSFEQYKKALSEEDYDTIDKFENYHCDSLYGNVKAEFYGTIFKMVDDIKEFKEFFDDQNYGSSAEDKEKIDSLMISKLEEHEEKDTGQVNYTAAYIDIQLNMYAIDKAKNAELAFVHIYEVMSDDKISTSDYDLKSDGMNRILETAFNKEATLTRNDKFKLDTIDNSSLRQKNVSRAYDKKQEALSIMDTASTVFRLTDESIKSQLKEAVEGIYKDVSLSIADLHKLSSMEEMYRTDYILTIERKNKIRKFYNSNNQ